MIQLLGLASLDICSDGVNLSQEVPISLLCLLVEACDYKSPTFKHTAE